MILEVLVCFLLAACCTGQVMFVLSDGDVNRGGSPEAAAAVLKSLDWEIYAIGIGSRDEARTRFDSISSDPLHKFAFTLEYEPRVVNIQSGGARISKRLPDLEKFVKQNIGGDVGMQYANILLHIVF